MNDLANLWGVLRAGGVTIVPLLGLAVVAAVVIVEKAFVYSTRSHAPGLSTETVQVGPGAVSEMTSCGSSSACSRGRRARWWVESRAGNEGASSRRRSALDLVLETIVTAAPLLGLLGTITGMIRSFRLFGDQGLVDPAGVTGGVAEALIATAVGLFIALTALFAFNFFSQRRAQLMDELERLGTRLVDRIRLDQEGLFDEVP